MTTQNILVTGGAGFIGANYTAFAIRQGYTVTVFDNLSRKGAAKNLAWLRETFGPDAFQFIHADIRDADALLAAARDKDAIYHLAGQVAVTTSVHNPREDFEINALGTFNVLEAARLSGRQPLVVYASTNKVYGGMDDLRLTETPLRWEYADHPHGISEAYPIDFHSPYGCSKGAGDQYVRDYARIYGFPTVVFRQSTIYGLRQFGVEDQGWLAHFVIAVVKNRPISIYGDGKQVRDMLWVEDLIAAYDLCLHHTATVAGDIFNVGGGPSNTISIWTESGPRLEQLTGHPIPVTYGDWRPGDQRIYVSDIRKLKATLGWEPKTSLTDGFSRLYHWVKDHPHLFDD